MMGCGVAYLYLKSRNETMSTRTKALLESAREKKERRQTRDSIALYEQALSVMKEENAHLAQAKVCSEIAQVHRDNGDMEKSEIAYKEALDHLDEVDHWKSAHIEGTLSLDALVQSGTNSPPSQNLQRKLNRDIFAHCLLR